MTSFEIELLSKMTREIDIQRDPFANKQIEQDTSIFSFFPFPFFSFFFLLILCHFYFFLLCTDKVVPVSL